MPVWFHTSPKLLQTYHTFCEAVVSGNEVRVIFCDISKAFDRVWHRGVLAKLTYFGISGNLLDWFKSYLSDRRQRVFLNGCSLDWAWVRAGVPQGSILGPLLFLIYIHDIVNEIQCVIKSFAADTSLYIIVENPALAAASLNIDLSYISNWAVDWLVDFHPTKSESMIISRSTFRPNPPPLLWTTPI